VLCVALSGCVLRAPAPEPTSDRPDPTELVTEDMTAIAEGDATRARELDQKAVDAEAEEQKLTVRPPDDPEAMRNDEVLQSAVLIENIEIYLTFPNRRDDEMAVDVEYDVGGHHEHGFVRVEWNDATSEWELASSMAYPTTVWAEKSEREDGAAPFRVDGWPDVLAPPSDRPHAYLAYPGVYTITAAFPLELLRDQSTAVQTVEVYLGSDDVTFDVTELPASPQ